MRGTIMTPEGNQGRALGIEHRAWGTEHGAWCIELQKNIIEALNFYFEERGIMIRSDNKVYLQAINKFNYDISVNVINHAEKINMNPTLLSQYKEQERRVSNNNLRRSLRLRKIQ